MPGRRSEPSGDLLLIAAATILILTARRHFQTPAPGKPDAQVANRAIAALVSRYGLFANPSTIGANLQTLVLMLSDGSCQIVQDQVTRVLEKGDTALGMTRVLWAPRSD